MQHKLKTLWFLKTELTCNRWHATWAQAVVQVSIVFVKGLDRGKEY